MAKAKIAAPIDRPLSRAYLRNFSGWSTAYPPGASEPTSFRVMENVFIERDGAVRIRPGLRKITDSTVAGDATLSAEGVTGKAFLGSTEPFYSPTGELTYLYAYTDYLHQTGTPAPVRHGGEPPYKHLMTTFAKFGRPAGAPLHTSQGGWALAPAHAGGVNTTAKITYVRYVQIDNRIVALLNSPLSADTPCIFDVGSTAHVQLQPRTVTKPKNGIKPKFSESASGTAQEGFVVAAPNSTFFKGMNLNGMGLSGAVRPSSDLLTNSGEYNFGYFITLSNEFGETEPSSMHTVKLARPHGQWSMLEWDPASDTFIASTDPDRVADRIIIYPARARYSNTNPLPGVPPVPWWDTAVSERALTMNVYCAMWSDNGVVPTEGQFIGSCPVKLNGWGAVSGTLASVEDVDLQGYVIHTPAAPPENRSHPIPSRSTIVNPHANTTRPGRPANAIVSADRIVYVYDRDRPGVIRWGSNQLGKYLSSSPGEGGGYKTLTSGNMQIPASVKLWQNPQSVDTITILNQGTDGSSTSLYMSPAEVSAQTDSTSVMGFETVTATPGTVAPYGVEVFNNSLFHPQEDQLMKTSANNYNLSHKTLTEDIKDQWLLLSNREKMISAEFDGRLYYIVTPEGTGHDPADPYSWLCNGTEIWVYDALSENGNWSRWTIPAISLKKMLFGDKVYLAVIRPEGIYILDEAYSRDDYHPISYPALTEGRPIRWRFETNTQGANRAHDAWAHLKQLVLTAGTFTGKMRYGIRGLDRHGQRVQVSKVFESPMPYAPSPREVPFDLEDALQVGKDMKEWFFHASSYEDKDGVVAHSRGRINSLQYRYTPVSVNVHGEEGSVETFEYGNSNNSPQSRTSNSGLTRPMYGPTASADTFQVAPQPE